MSTRPPVLFPLFADLEVLDGIGPKTAKHFDGLNVSRPRDLLFVLPYAGIDRRLRTTIQGLNAPKVATVEVEVGQHRPAPRKGGAHRVTVEDAQTSFSLVFFHAGKDYLQKLLPTGQRRIVSGKVEIFDGVLQMVHPDHVLPIEEAVDLPEFEPVYPLTSGVSLKLMRRAIASAQTRVPDLKEWIEPSLLRDRGWPAWKGALAQAHAPENVESLSPDSLARQRLAYDELLAHQLTLALARAHRRAKPGIVTRGTGDVSAKVLEDLPYRPTGAQTRALSEISADMAAPERMNRLLQGDVGSGKTLVALMALIAAVEASGQGVLMAPTEILARQHLESLQPLADNAGIRMELLTGRDKGADRREKLAALVNGQIQILIGTHAVFQTDVHFSDLRLAVIDEQHRFGVSQRLALGEKGAAVDVLVMTATPIPRSLALAQYGDMDVSILDEKPPGRTPVKTVLVSDGRMAEVVENLRRAVAEGKQAYWVCPLVEESEIVDMTAAEERFKRLRAALGEDVVGLVHGQLHPVEKDAAMARFVAGNTSVLVATTVIEVGVNVPNASIMVVERAEAFGLAQLHQLRGRVGRGAAASSCLLMYHPPLTEGGRRRLEALRATEDGFQISEEDLALRGAGDLIGTAQSGLPRFRVADMERDHGLMAVAQSDARALLHQDPDLETQRGKAARVLLWLMEQEKAIRLISVG
jgi:ATP-dependent DNA helicase RecG